MTSVCVMIPVTSRDRNWKCFKETDLYNIFFKSFLLTYNKEIPHLICLAIDPDDKLFNSIKKDIEDFVTIMKNCKIHFISTKGIEKGHVTEMWNRCFEYGIQESYDYFLQCGDDIEFYTGGWENHFIHYLQNHQNIGICGFSDLNRLQYNPNDRLLTQSFVHSTHYEIFGHYFPKQIKNWGCDDWITEIYRKTDNCYYSLTHTISNKGGNPRYDIVNNRTLWNRLIDIDYRKINKFKLFLKKKI